MEIDFNNSGFCLISVDRRNCDFPPTALSVSSSAQTFCRLLAFVVIAYNVIVTFLTRMSTLVAAQLGSGRSRVDRRSSCDSHHADEGLHSFVMNYCHDEDRSRHFGGDKPRICCWVWSRCYYPT